MNLLKYLPIFFIVLFTSNAAAQGNRTAMEAFYCSFQDGKDMSDLKKVSAEWDSWADSNFSERYAGYVLTPVLATGSDFPFDFVWLGVSDNLATLGTVMGEWMSKGSKLQAKFDAVSSCDSHMTIDSFEDRPYAQIGQAGLLQIRSCIAQEGVTFGQIVRARSAAFDWFSENEVAGGNYMWLPGAGMPVDSDISFYDVWVTSSLSERGAALEKMYQLDWDEYRGIAGRNSLWDCDNPRVWYATPVGGREAD